MADISPKYAKYFDGLEVHGSEKAASKAAQEKVAAQEGAEKVKGNISPQYQKYFEGFNVTDGKSRPKEQEKKSSPEAKKPNETYVSSFGAGGIPLGNATPTASASSTGAFVKSFGQGLKDVGYGIAKPLAGLGARFNPPYDPGRKRTAY